MKALTSALASVFFLGAVLCSAGAQPSLIQVVAGENFWGSIASQLGGNRVHVLSVVTDPNADPHEYESSAATARAFADARYVVLNGAGYDAWAQRLVAASSGEHRRVMVVADLLGKPPGSNPHFWYNPQFVERVADRITADYVAIDPASADYYRARRVALERSLGPYHALIAKIRNHFHDRPVGSTESIFVYLADALGLKLLSPAPFMEAVANDTDPAVSSVIAFEGQIDQHRIRLLVYNSQTVTAVTTRMKQLAVAHHVPVVAISETIQPPSASFQDWQTKQLVRIAAALR